MAEVKKSFGEYVFDTLKEDNELGKYVEDLILSSEEAKRKAKVSSVVGGVLAATVGFGWSAQTGTGIIFKDSPISLGVVYEDGKMCFYLNSSYPRATYMGIWVEAKTKGLVHKEIVDVGLRFYDKDPMRRRIEKDRNLLNQLLGIFKTGNFENISEHTQARINIKIEDGARATIEANAHTDTKPDTLKDFFRCLMKIATYVRLGPALGTRKRVFWVGATNKELKTTGIDIPDSSQAPWDIDRTWLFNWHPYEVKDWKDEWCDSTKCKITMCDALSNQVVKQIVLGCQRAHDGFGVEELDNVSERLAIWGKLYFLIEVTGYEGQWRVEVGFFEDAGGVESEQREERFLSTIEQGQFE